MKSKVYDLKEYQFKKDEKILIDTNIWLYLYPPPSNPTPKFARYYSKAYLSLLQSGAIPILDVAILGEYLNRYLKVEYDANYKDIYKTFKEFRSSADFNNNVKPAIAYAKRILKDSELGFIIPRKSTISDMLSNYSAGFVDFTDAIIVELCLEMNYRLLTNDADFKNSQIEVITSNQRLLR